MDNKNSKLLQLLSLENLLDQTILVGSRKDIPAIMNCLDIHILGSAYGEAFPNVICEAMSCGTVCAATDVGDCKLIISDTGAICPPKNPEALANGIQILVPASTLDSSHQAARARIVENFSLQTMVGKYKAVWQEALEPKP